MKAGHLTACALALWVAAGPAAAQSPPLTAPSFHHLHLNVVDPDAMIAFLTRQFPSTSRISWGGQPALASPTNALILFNRVSAPAPSDPAATAFWHFGWGVRDERASLESFKTRPEVKLAPLYTTDDGAMSTSAATPGRAPAVCWD